MSKVLLERSLYNNLLIYFGIQDTDTADTDIDDDDDLTDLYYRIRDQLAIKQQTQVAREAYTKYKKADSANERERGRQKYLEARGIPHGSRWSADYEAQR